MKWILVIPILFTILFKETTTTNAIKIELLNKADSLRANNDHKAGYVYAQAFKDHQNIPIDSIKHYFSYITKYLDIVARSTSIVDNTDSVIFQSILKSVENNWNEILEDSLIAITDKLRYLRSLSTLSKNHYFKPYRAYEYILTASEIALSRNDVPSRVKGILVDNLCEIQNEIGLHASTIRNAEFILNNYPDQDNNTTIRLLASMGTAYLNIGSFAHTRDYFLKKHSAILQSEQDQSTIASSLMDIGVAMEKCKLFDSAKYYYIQALHVFEKSQQEDELTMAKIYNNMGNNFMANDKNSEAIEAFNTSQRFRKDTSDTEGFAKLFYNIALNYYYLNQIDSCILYFNKSIVWRSKQLKENHINLAQTFHSLAKAYLKINKSKEAINFFNKSINAFDTYYDSEFNQLTLYNKINIGKEIEKNIGDYIDFIISMNNDTSQYFFRSINLLLKYKNNLALKGLVSPSDKHIQTVLNLKASLDTLSVIKHSRERQNIIQQIEHLEENNSKLVRKSKSVVDLAYLQKNMAAKDGILLFHFSNLDSNYYVFLITKSKVYHTKDSTLELLRNNLSNIFCTTSSSLQHLYIYLDLQLSKLSIESIRLPCISQNYSFDKYTFHYIVNSHEFLPTSNKNYKSKSISILGNPITDHLTYLPSSEFEIEQIKNIFKQNKWIVNSYEKQDFNSQNILKANRSSNILHFSSHSSVKPADTEPCTFYIPLEDIKLYLGHQKDQFISAYQLSGIDFSQADLISLASCKSAVSNNESMTQMMSLSSSFKMSGAKQVLASLWNVADKPTAELMIEFYKSILNGNTYPDALKKAKSKLRTIYPEPEFWAGFILIGDESPLNNTKIHPLLWILFILSLIVVSYYFIKKIMVEI